MDKIRLLIASEDSSMSRGLKAIFTAERMFEVIGEFNLAAALQKCMDLQPDAIVLDMNKDETNYEEKLEQIKKNCPCSFIFVLADNEQMQNISPLLQRVDGIIPKGIMRGSLVKTVELTCQSGLFCIPASLKKKVSKISLEKLNTVGDLKNKELTGNESLTRRELEILQLVAKNYSNRDIANKLYISEPTVKTHVSSILRKLGQTNRVQAIVYSYKQGILPPLGLTENNN